VIVAAAHDRAAVLREGNGGDRKIVFRHHAARGLGAQVIESQFFANAAGERFAVGRERQ
jgi:hypothetical protein